MSLHVTFIVNPIAGRGKAPRAWQALRREMARFESRLQWDVLFTSAPGHAEAFAREARDPGRERILVAVGGDGTVNELVNGILRTRGNAPALAVFPAGTGCDFSRAIESPSTPGEFLEALVDDARSRTPREADVFLIADASGRTRCAINSVGIGFDAQVARVVHSSRWLKRLGFLSYALGVFGALLTYAPADMRLELETREGIRDVRIGRAWLTSISNGPYYGGGMKICPHALFGDGLMDVSALNAVPRWRLPPLVLLAFRGMHVGRPEVSFFRATAVRISAGRDLPLHLDGDPVPMRMPITARVIPAAVKLMAARTSAKSSLPKRPLSQGDALDGGRMGEEHGFYERVGIHVR